MAKNNEKTGNPQKLGEMEIFIQRCKFELCIYNHSVIISEFIISELKEKLKIKFNYSGKEVTEIIDLLSLKFKVTHDFKSWVTFFQNDWLDK